MNIDKDINEALEEVKLYKEGKLELQTYEEFEKEMNIDKDIERVRNFINHIRFEEPAQYSLQEWFLAIESMLEKVEASKSELITKEEHEKLKWERDYYKLRFKELNKQWHRVINELLGEDYYNMGCDWQSCNEFSADDLIYKYKKRWWQFWRKI